jgi:predicted short-subunit dehydrogenase-like oxidoreductase (DUF2520 family)
MGRLGSALYTKLVKSGYNVSAISSRRSRRQVTLSDVVWFCVPDAAIADAAQNLSSRDWRRKCALHSSGVLTSDVLDFLRTAGASVASAHPLMTFVKRSVPEFTGVPFAIEGDAGAVRVARSIVRELGAKSFPVAKKHKLAYHAFATLVCPLLVSLLATAEKTARFAGMSEREARRRMIPIIYQTLRNYEKLGPAPAFSGPIVRGDVQTVRAHLQALAAPRVQREVYSALAQAAVEYLPSANRRELARLLQM